MKLIFISILIAGTFIIGAYVFSNDRLAGTNDLPREDGNNVAIEDGKQIIEVDVLGGGYSPRLSEAQAGVPTILRMKTNGFFSCAGALSIPAISYRENLPLTGVTDIELPAGKVGQKLRGLCAMGMYSFEIVFN